MIMILIVNKNPKQSRGAEIVLFLTLQKESV